MNKEGFSLLEMVVVMSINLILFGISLPLFWGPIHDSQFGRFQDELLSSLIGIRRLAQKSGRPLWLTVPEKGGVRYRINFDSQDGELFLKSSGGSGYEGSIQCRLPAGSLPHPVSGIPIDSAFRSTHGTGFVFRAKGSSSGSLLFSDEEGRAIMMILSGQTGRFRVFKWDRFNQQWMDIF